MTGLTTVILRVGDLGRAVEFYRDVLGLETASVGPGIAFFAFGSVTLALKRVDGGDPAAAACATEVVLEVEDPVGAFERWRAAGVPFAADLRPVLESEGRRLLAAQFRDPDGHLLSLTGWVPGEAGH